MKTVVDASSLLLLIKHSKEAELLKKLKDAASLDLTAYEVGNGLWKWISLKRSVSLVEARDLITTLTRIFSMDGFSVIGFRDLNQSAILDLAAENNITFYDACYIMASVMSKVPLVTEDEKLKRVAAKYVRVLSWKDV
ncbi:MAG: type II toxin-antitoxin system VapC family toxin [Candidatus Brockarchaeota archaeon]|nr:type II toxin-antitoxin system VapC family toxin [Candidatus Brockarchaeota archaeon]